jgi:hypothetical protein
VTVTREGAAVLDLVGPLTRLSAVRASCWTQSTPPPPQGVSILLGWFQADLDELRNMGMEGLERHILRGDGGDRAALPPSLPLHRRTGVLVA